MTPSTRLSSAVAGTRPPRPTTLGRLGEYLLYMFPPYLFVPVGVGTFFSINFFVQATMGVGPLRVTWRAIPAALTYVLVLLLMRAYDELKDVETDVRLGKAGDPLYATRPIVTGHVRAADLVALRWITTIALFLLNAPLARGPQLWFAGLMILTWFSFKWFFWPPMKDHLVVAFLTHNPLTALLGGYVVSVAVGEAGGGAVDVVRAWTIVVGFWAPVALWELSRKVRAPQDETDYVTYSKVLGWRVAAWLPAVAASISVVALGWVASSAGLGFVYVGTLVTSAALVVGACARFFFAPSTRTSKLKPFAEVFNGIVTVATLAALIARWSVTWR